MNALPITDAELAAGIEVVGVDADTLTEVKVAGVAVCKAGIGLPAATIEDILEESPTKVLTPGAT
jgi:hypothetical protein